MKNSTPQADFKLSLYNRQGVGFELEMGVAVGLRDFLEILYREFDERVSGNPQHANAEADDIIYTISKTLEQELDKSASYEEEK